MPYGDPEKQKAYLRAYYHKYLKKPTTKRGGNLKIDLMNYKPKPLGDVRNPTLDHYTKPLKFEYDFLDTEAVNLDTVRKDTTLAGVKGNVVDFLDYKGNLKTAKQLKKEIDEEYYTRKNKTPRQPTKPLLKAINLYEDDGISKMTDTNIKSKIEELSRCLTDEEFDGVIDYCNKLFGKHKSRTKLEHAYKDMLRICKSK
jgi:hypothetical protein